MFFFAVLYKDNVSKIHGCIDKDGGIHFKAYDIATILGYKKPAEMIKTYVKDAPSMEMLLYKDGVSNPTRTVIPLNSKMIDNEQVRIVLSRITKSNDIFCAWYIRLWNNGLEADNLDVEQWKRNPSFVPVFYLNTNGNWSLQTIHSTLVSPANNQLSINVCDEPVESIEIGPIGKDGVPESLYYCTEHFMFEYVPK